MHSADFALILEAHRREFLNQKDIQRIATANLPACSTLGCNRPADGQEISETERYCAKCAVNRLIRKVPNTQ